MVINICCPFSRWRNIWSKSVKIQKSHARSESWDVHLRYNFKVAGITVVCKLSGIARRVRMCLCEDEHGRDLCVNYSVYICV